MVDTYAIYGADAVANYHRSLIEECCAGAVILWLDQSVGWYLHRPIVPNGVYPEYLPILLANATPSLLEDVARELLHRGARIAQESPGDGGQRVANADQSGPDPSVGAGVKSTGVSLPEVAGGSPATRPPVQQLSFAAAWHEGPEGRTYVLVSAECEECCDADYQPTYYQGEVCGPRGCLACNGTRARVDVGEIARRYGGDGGARVARFVVKMQPGKMTL